jgi:hypothetical protein
VGARPHLAGSSASPCAEFKDSLTRGLGNPGSDVSWMSTKLFHPHSVSRDIFCEGNCDASTMLFHSTAFCGGGNAEKPDRLVPLYVLREIRGHDTYPLVLFHLGPYHGWPGESSMNNALLSAHCGAVRPLQNVHVRMMDISPSRTGVLSHTPGGLPVLVHIVSLACMKSSTTPSPMATRD